MKDLDMGDVMADARRMEQDYYDQLMLDFDRLDDVELNRVLYINSITARSGVCHRNAITAVQIINYLRLARINTTLCEGCFDRTGCDMCCPDYYPFDGFGDDQDDHYERFGRPALPNEH